MYFPIMGRNLFCWLLGWELGGCVCMRDSCSEGCPFVERMERKGKRKKLTCKNENFPPLQYTTLPISSPDVCKSKSLP